MCHVCISYNYAICLHTLDLIFTAKLCISILEFFIYLEVPSSIFMYSSYRACVLFVYVCVCVFMCVLYLCA